MGRIVAIAGGDLESNKPLNKYAVNMIESKSKNVLFIGTASGDAEGYIDNITKLFSLMNCKVKSLCLITKSYSSEQIDELLAWADLIYVGGGDTVYMMDVWKQYGLDVRLKEIYKNDSAVLMGVSAGAICWFNCGHSDSEHCKKNEGQLYGWANGMLDIHHLAYCPHYEEEGKDSFDVMLNSKSIGGLAMEKDTAFVENNGVVSYIKSNEKSKAYMLKFINGVLDKAEIECELIRE